MNLLAHYLLPHQTNNHKAKIIRPSGLSLVLAFFLILQLAVRSFGSVGPQILGYAANISPAEVIRLTNEKRAQNGLPAVAYNGQLALAAQAKAAHMIANGYWAHVAPDGTQPWKFFGDTGYRYKYAGENLARDFSNPSSAVDAWMASPTHRDNLLSAKYKEIGVAVIDGQMGGAETTIVVQFFGARVGDVLPTQPVAAKTEVTKATPEPIVIPTPISPGLTPVEASQRVLISPFNITKGASSVIVSILMVVLLIDMVIIARRRISRVSSRSFAHFAFFGMIMVIIVIMKAGKII